ncbi:MAG: methylated-DNA--[protein]-cysteine S-methyltransferase [Sutterellaceae bacterium]|nr:methylated-DNA--[protein]-cysteine S-methyltransferase [Sutterellaceae bacterium]MDD7441500.1 methylated-DNA--[protein]-cysteine S-methyltransferase [Sutterellaceae bacterium]MDY2869096.1 methylated-DNA--[protein]-cysteine S-methyltransferase [Mesosutterella sp.]
MRKHALSGSARTVTVERLETPAGALLIGDSDGALVFIDWESGKHGSSDRVLSKAGLRAVPGSTPLTRRASSELREYFEGKRKSFDLPLLPIGSDFEKAVWQELGRVPWGTTTTYGAIARGIGKPKAAHAVGAAVGRNPFAIVIPCHRVLGKDGGLTGYDGGLAAKTLLLRLEGALLA